MYCVCTIVSQQPSGIDVILPKMVEFIPMLIAFVVVAIILAKFGWPAFEGMLDKRAEKIKNDLKESEEKRLEAEKILEETTKRLLNAQIKVDMLIEDAKNKAQENSNRIEKEAKIHAKAVKDKAKLTIEQDKRLAEHELKTEAVDIALAVTSKVLSKDMSDEEHRKIIEQYVNEVSSLKG